MKQNNIIDLAAYRKQPEYRHDSESNPEPQQLDELSVAILSLIQRLRDSNPLKQTG